MAQRQNSNRGKTPSYILIGNGFDEMEVVTFLHTFRQAGLGIKSISLHDKLVYSQQGVALKADLLLADTHLNPRQECLFILPAAGRNGETLRHDARVKSLLEALSAGKSAIAVTDGSSTLADDVAAQIAPPHRPQPGENLDTFIQSLVEHLLFAN
jgi:putative intracellular protease/amidase